MTGLLLIAVELWRVVVHQRALDWAHFSTADKPPVDVPVRRGLAKLIDNLADRTEHMAARALDTLEQEPAVYFHTRLRTFVSGVALLLVGFVLQILSAIPGGIPLLGIVP